MADILLQLLRANLVAGLAVMVVLALRLPTRRQFGAHTAYALWLMVPLAFIASLIPAAEAETEAAAEAAQASALFPAPLVQLPETLDAPMIAGLWAVGLTLAIALVAMGQIRFLRRAKMGKAGPALVGVICPRIVTPFGYDTQFSDAERALVRAHERAHMDRGDPKVNALIALAQCLCWFNPLVHLAAHLARIDQELACDATVMQRRPGARRLYAETMLKTQLVATALPLGCHWLAGGRHPLEARISMLKRPRASERRAMVGAGAVAGLAVVAGYGAWAAQPPVAPRPYFVPLPLRLENRLANEHAVVMIHLSAVQVAALPRPADKP